MTTLVDTPENHEPTQWELNRDFYIGKLYQDAQRGFMHVLSCDDYWVMALHSS